MSESVKRRAEEETRSAGQRAHGQFELIGLRPHLFQLGEAKLDLMRPHQRLAERRLLIRPASSAPVQTRRWCDETTGRRRHYFTTMFVNSTDARDRRARLLRGDVLRRREGLGSSRDRSRGPRNDGKKIAQQHVLASRVSQRILSNTSHSSSRSTWPGIPHLQGYYSSSPSSTSLSTSPSSSSSSASGSRANPSRSRPVSQ